MPEILLLVLGVLVGVVLVLQIVLLTRKTSLDVTPLEESARQLRGDLERLERALREEIARNRDELATAARLQREELAQSLKAVGDTLLQQLIAQAAGSEQKHEQMRQTVEQRLQLITEEMGKRLDAMRGETMQSATRAREEVTLALKNFNESVRTQLEAIGSQQRTQLGNMQEQLGKLSESNEKRLEQMRQNVEQKLQLLQQDNTQKLEQIRTTVDEKLQGTLEKRLGESFKLVSDRLEQVHKGLGEMQTLASSVGDLKKVMTNVKTRGGWGEMQLEALLTQMLSPAQYASNVATKTGSSDVVEFAIRLPGQNDDPGEALWLPIDAKFPKEYNHRLVMPMSNPTWRPWMPPAKPWKYASGNPPAIYTTNTLTRRTPPILASCICRPKGCMPK